MLMPGCRLNARSICDTVGVADKASSVHIARHNTMMNMASNSVDMKSKRGGMGWWRCRIVPAYGVAVGVVDVAGTAATVAAALLTEDCALLSAWYPATRD